MLFPSTLQELRASSLSSHTLEYVTLTTLARVILLQVLLSGTRNHEVLEMVDEEGVEESVGEARKSDGRMAEKRSELDVL